MEQQQGQQARVDSGPPCPECGVFRGPHLETCGWASGSLRPTRYYLGAPEARTGIWPKPTPEEEDRYFHKKPEAPLTDLQKISRCPQCKGTVSREWYDPEGLAKDRRETTKAKSTTTCPECGCSWECPLCENHLGTCSILKEQWSPTGRWRSTWATCPCGKPARAGNDTRSNAYRGDELVEVRCPHEGGVYCCWTREKR